jgi:cellulose synthase/poly-beta-1,6-N-acetylglucosamine synthase-like glycosyltransferase
LNSFFYVFLLLSLLTDGLFVFLHLPRRRRSGKSQKVSFDPSKLTIIIASYNGEDVITETVKQANIHVPLRQILVVSDASTDNTAEAARAAGARVIVNPQNLHKVGSINAAMVYVHTPYVLIVDDDTLIGDTIIPTSLLDEGFTAVAFNVMPVAVKSLVNELQRFEYRVSMQVGKHLRASTGAIGNVSGAIGLYRSADLRRQITMHSGQFSGEDEQRTLLAHLYGEGKGITYTDSLVLTEAPATYKELFTQRAYSWAMSTPELFFLYWRVLLSHKFHYLLKAEKAYLIYIYLTDPLRILFCWTLFMQPKHLFVAYGFYFVLNLITWLRLGRKDTFRSVALSPLYSLGLTLCRFIGNFYWLKEKGTYLIRRKHRNAPQRYLLAEYCLIFLVIIGSWGMSVHHFRNEMNLFKTINTQKLTDNGSVFSYTTSPTSTSSSVLATSPDASYVLVSVEAGDTSRAVAYKAIQALQAEQPTLQISSDLEWKVEELLGTQLPTIDSSSSGVNTVLQVQKDLIKQAIATAQGSTQ